MRTLRLVLAIVVVVVMAIAVIGIGQGDSPLATSSVSARPLSAKQVKASKRRIARGGKRVQRGKEEFAQEDCGDCHTLAAVGAKGELGPRLDRQTTRCPRSLATSPGHGTRAPRAIRVS